MSALQVARDAAHKAAEALRAAEGRAEAEAAARDARNAEKRRAYYSKVAASEDYAGAGQTMQSHLADFRQAVADGDGAAILSTYCRYAYQGEVLSFAAKRVRDQLGDDAPSGGLGTFYPESFGTMLDAEVKQAADAHRVAYVERIQADLAAVLEPDE